MVKQVYSDVESLEIYCHAYGIDGVLGAFENEPPLGHEVGVVVDIIAPTQELAREIGYDFSLRVSFWRYPGRQTTAGNVAVLFSPSVIDAGPVYDLQVYHALPVSDPTELFPTRMLHFKDGRLHE
jgi:hypothetical protein